MITQREISQLAFRQGMSDKVIEKDYVITWLLTGIADSSLGDLLAFKGGTAIKKSYVPDYRFSEDLDFTVFKNADGEMLIGQLENVIKRLAKSQGFQFAIPPDRIERRTDSLTLYVNFVGPLQARLDSRAIKVDFTLSEKLIFPIESMVVHSPYSDAHGNQKISTYSLEEILIEKLCAIIGRTEPRDVYDANFLFGLELDFHRIADAFKEKAESKRYDPSRIVDALDRKEVTYARMWNTRLEHQIKDLPHLDEALRGLQRSLRKYVIEA